MAEVGLDCGLSPDIVLASAWSKMDSDGAPPGAKITNDGYTEYSPGGGMHVTLSPTDLHNLALAAGPDFGQGVTSTLPSGNVDIVPTLLWLMDLQPEKKLDGRVLHEALTAKHVVPSTKPGELNTHRDFSEGTWKQYLRFTEVEGVRYLEEGNGNWRATSPSSTPGSKNDSTVSPEHADLRH